MALQEGHEWAAAASRLLEECVESWNLRIGDRFPSGEASLTHAALTAGGEEVVLKIGMPHRESEHESAALEQWAGNGAVRLLAEDPSRHALLLERCFPGTPLADLDQDAALDVMMGLYPRLWLPAGAPFRPLAEEAAWWIDYLPRKWETIGRPFERSLVNSAVTELEELRGTQGEQVLLHQDLHADNVLRAEREAWLVIDPKPLVGEREFGIAAMVRGGELGHGATNVRHRLDRLTAELGLDRERARGWALGQTLAWAFDERGELRRLVECARWLLS